jgi:hypothetical protein
MTSSFPAAINSGAATTVPAGWSSTLPPHCIAQLTAFFAFQRELMRTEAAWMAGVPYWDAKQAIARHVLADAHHAESLLKRLHELKATSAEHKQLAGLEEAVRDIASAAHGDEWLFGLYTVVKPWFVQELESYLLLSDPVMDEPSGSLLVTVIEDQRLQIAWFHGYKPKFSDWETTDTAAWCAFVRSRLTPALLRGGEPAKTPSLPIVRYVANK